MLIQYYDMRRLVEFQDQLGSVIEWVITDLLPTGLNPRTYGVKLKRDPLLINHSLGSTVVYMHLPRGLQAGMTETTPVNGLLCYRG